MEELKQTLLIFSSWIIETTVINGSMVFIAYFLVWKKLKPKILNHRIQVIERVNEKQIKRELKSSICTIIAFTLFNCIVFYLTYKWYTKIYTHISDYNIFLNIFILLLLIIIDDTWFYWYHRLLHTKKWFRYIHYKHHKSFDVNPISSLSFHFIEPFFLLFWIIPVSIFIPIYAPILFIIQIISVLNNVKSHLWYEFYPKLWNKNTFSFITTSTHHNMHHSKINWNYGWYFRIWDRLLNTEFKDYEIVYDKIQENILKK